MGKQRTGMHRLGTCLRRLTVKHMKRPLPIIVLCLLLLLTACGNDEIDASLTDPDPVPSTEPESTDPSVSSTDDETYVKTSEPPAIVLSRSDETVSVDAWTYCWTPSNGDDGICADGTPPETLPVLPGDGPITMEFPVDFDFLATIYEADYGNEVGKTAVVATEEGWEINPETTGPAVLEILGRGPDGDDVIVSVAIG